jgi:hypothetical protein
MENLRKYWEENGETLHTLKANSTAIEKLSIDYQELDEFLTFGSNSCGDPICIDLSNGEQIVYLNHDNGFESIFINTDIRKFAFSLAAYHDFFNSLLSPEIDDLSHRKFTDEEFEVVKTNFLAIDIEALRDNSFWVGELEALLWERNNE